MIDTTELAQHTGMLKGAVDAHAGLPAAHWETLKGIIADGAPDARDTSEIRVIATELALYGTKLSVVGRRLLATVGETDDEETAEDMTDEEAERVKNAYKSAAKDSPPPTPGTPKVPGAADRVATDSGLVAPVLHLPRYMGERQGAKATAPRTPTWLEKLMPKR